MSYQEAIAALENLNKRKLLSPIFLRLDRVTLLLKYLDIDLAMPSIHIAGTSGKGSTSWLTASVLTSAGYKVGLHTTPHLQTPRERMRVNGLYPTEQEFADLASEVLNTAYSIETKHSYGAFKAIDCLFAIAMLYFKQHKIDIAVIETFVGGQNDPTNIIEPLVSVITNVDMDHMATLGKTLEAITSVKAGVIKENTPFITGATQPKVRAMLERRAKDKNAPFFAVGQENKHQAKLIGQNGSILSATVLNNLFAKIHLGLLGRHQIDNAVLSLYIIQVLRSRGWLVSDEAIRSAFSETFIPGRLEIIDQQPKTILDGAHNPAKAKALATSLKKLFPKQKIVYVLALKQTKDMAATIKPLLPNAKKIIITEFDTKKSRSPALMKKFIIAHSVPATTRKNPILAYALAKRQAKKDDIICVTGSLYLVGKLRELWYPTN